MIGAIVGDIAGSPYEFDNIKTTDFPLFGAYHGKKACATDDSVMTLAIAQALLDAAEDLAALPAAAVRRMREFVRRNRALIHAHWIGEVDSSVVSQLDFGL